MPDAWEETYRRDVEKFYEWMDLDKGFIPEKLTPPPRPRPQVWRGLWPHESHIAEWRQSRLPRDAHVRDWLAYNRPAPCQLFPDSKARMTWVLYQCRAGVRQADIARMLGLSPERTRQLRMKAERHHKGWAARRWLPPTRIFRPIDMGGPRDVWLEFYPPPDPRLDNMAPVRP